MRVSPVIGALGTAHRHPRDLPGAQLLIAALASEWRRVTCPAGGSAHAFHARGMRYRLSINVFAINVFAMGWFLLGLTPIAKAQDPPPPLPGEFVIQTMVKQAYLTAVDGGGRTTNVIHTDAARIGSWEKFRLLGPSGYPRGQYVVQTVSGNYLTAVLGGGLSAVLDPAGQPTDVIHADATRIGSWEKFRLGLDQQGWRNTIQTVDGHYLTAVGGGGKTTDAIHTDAVKADNWEYFWVWKCGDLGSGYQYTIHAPMAYSVFAYGGGGRVATRVGVFVSGAIGTLADYARRPVPFDNDWQKFKLIQQSDGSYALQTSNGINYVTAIRGGGLRSGTITYDNLVTDRTQAQAWERFRFVNQGDCTYAIQTVSGYYLGKRSAAPGTLGAFSTDVSEIRDAIKFRLVMSFADRR
jgi:hypothetical protein